MAKPKLDRKKKATYDLWRKIVKDFAEIKEMTDEINSVPNDFQLGIGVFDDCNPQIMCGYYLRYYSELFSITLHADNIDLTFIRTEDTITIFCGEFITSNQINPWHIDKYILSYFKDCIPKEYEEKYSNVIDNIQNTLLKYFYEYKRQKNS